MTFTKTTSKLTDEQRENLTELVINRWLDSLSFKDLERFFYDLQRDYLRDYTDEELIGAVEDVTYEDEFEELLNQ